MQLKSLFQKLDFWAKRLVSFPGCTQKTLNQRKTMWIATVFGIIHVIIHTSAFLIFFSRALSLLINYGFSLLVILTVALLVLPKLVRGFNLYCVVHLSTLLLITFYVILKLGGIASSAGLIFACLAFVLSSVPLQNTRITVFLFLLFVVIIVLSGLLVPWLTVPEEITPKINAIVFVMNTSSMSLIIFYLTISFFSQQSHIEKLEASKLKEVNDAKDKLFTNITHEFRTPLTVIQGMTDLIGKNPNEWLTEGIQKIKNNSQILLNLVNQMLDLAKVESGMMPIQNVQGNINAYVEYVAGLFESMAQNSGITLICKTTDRPLVMDFDPDKLLHILSNLISNALKYTPEGGSVEVTAEVEDSESYFTIRVADSGTGIDPKYLPHIFERFFHVDSDIRFQEGTGLGLSLAKEFTEMMNGQIFAESRAGSGSVFTVRLPVRNEALVEDVFGSQKMTESVKTFLPVSIESKLSGSDAFSKGSQFPLLLIVEDSNDVSQYLSAILKHEFHIEKANNGLTGLEMAFDTVPDIILSDVMMPEMDGISLLEKVKSDIRTSHIPVVLLTAKADMNSRLSGLERGADAYLAKPFDERELHIVLKNLIEIRRKLHERYASPDGFPEVLEPEFRMEDEFMQRVKCVLEANLGDDEFGVAELCREMAVSRAQLYRKFKSVSNKTIAEYFKLLRLYKAKALLSGNKMNVTEAAFASGFKNLSYFSREFSAEFGLSPVNYLRNPNLRPTVNK